MLRAALATLALSGGCAAQEVALGSGRCARYPVDQAVGQPFGSGGTVSSVPAWLTQPGVSYFAIPSFTSQPLTLTPEGAGTSPSRSAAALGNANTASAKACGGMGWAKLEAGEHICLNSDELEQPRQTWGWTNRLEQGDVFDDIPVFIGASQCQGGHHRFSIDVSFVGSTVVVDLSNNERNSLRAAHLWVGKTMLPRSRSGRFTSSPGLFPIMVNVNDPPVITLDDMDPYETYWFAVHVNVQCTRDETATPSPAYVAAAAPLCPNTFFIVQYWCGYPACMEGVSGNLGALLVEDEWVLVRAPALTFTLEETGGYLHDTRLFAKEIDAVYTTPVAEGPATYIAALAAGCDVTLQEPPARLTPGPRRALCKGYCPPGSVGFTAR